MSEKKEILDFQKMQWELSMSSLANYLMEVVKAVTYQVTHTEAVDNPNIRVKKLGLYKVFYKESEIEGVKLWAPYQITTYIDKYFLKFAETEEGNASVELTVDESNSSGFDLIENIKILEELMLHFAAEAEYIQGHADSVLENAQYRRLLVNNIDRLK